MTIKTYGWNDIEQLEPNDEHEQQQKRKIELVEDWNWTLMVRYKSGYVLEEIWSFTRTKTKR
ncbi:hypothetical protein HYD96_00885 [Mycoplasmopsis bovis]|nr:hypothetical protein [Mycoplasmopsis bovis]QQH34611.1 hypothetical protein HYD96_00885 [Mycoplasmopsis bovis]